MNARLLLILPTTTYRARAFMPPGTISPFVIRFDAGTVPVGYLVFSSRNRGSAFPCPNGSSCWSVSHKSSVR